jgi:large subunit ribosomal protein L18
MQRKQKDLKTKRLRVARGVRRRLHGLPEKPRLSVFRSNRYFYCQAIDDENGRTLASISSLESAYRSGEGAPKSEQVKALGQEMAKRLKEAGVERAVFDRGWYKYHGCVKHFADAVRAGGVRF